MKRLRWLLLVLVVIAAAIALAPLIPLGPLRPEIEAGLSELFNREVQIGSMRLSLLFGAITSLLKRENRLTIPVSVTGDVRDPKVRVDVVRLFKLRPHEPLF